MPLTFDELRVANVARCKPPFHGLHDWSPTDWSNALAGDVGEACGITHNMLQGNAGLDPIRDLANKIADIVISADFLAARCGIDLARIMSDTISGERGSSIVDRSDDQHEAPRATDAEVMLDDIACVLRALGLGDHARPYSPHLVFQDEIMPAVKLLVRKAGMQ